MECIKVPNTNAREIKIISDFDHQREKASQTSYDPLEKLSADFFGILQFYSQDISDCKLTKDTLYRSLVEYCKEEEALPPRPPPTEDFSSNIVPMEDGEVWNTNALFRAGEIEFISDFDHQREKAEILSMLKMSGIELGENCGESLVETRPSAHKHETPAEVVTSNSACVQQKRKRSPISDDPFWKEDLDVVFGTSMLQYKELPCDDMEHVRLCSALCEKQAMKKRRFLMVDDQET